MMEYTVGNSTTITHVDGSLNSEVLGACYASIFCPQPLRPTPTVPGQKQRAKLISTIERELTEAAEEIQSILGSSFATSSLTRFGGGLSCFSPLTEQQEQQRQQQPHHVPESDSGLRTLTPDIPVSGSVNMRLLVGHERILQPSPVKFNQFKISRNSEASEIPTLSSSPQQKKAKVKRNNKKKINSREFKDDIEITDIMEEDGTKEESQKSRRRSRNFTNNTKQQQFNLLMRPSLGNSQSVLPPYPAADYDDLSGSPSYPSAYPTQHHVPLNSIPTSGPSSGPSSNLTSGPSFGPSSGPSSGPTSGLSSGVSSGLSSGLTSIPSGPVSGAPSSSSGSVSLIVPPTPPLRTLNPVPFNSSFSKIQGTGSEFGLLSVSPPPLPLEEEDSFLRYDRLTRIRRTMSTRVNDPHNNNSNNYNNNSNESEDGIF